MEYIRNLQNNAFTLGIEEAKQFSRGAFLRIFRSVKNDV
ncbi:hypothetical protein AB6A40_011575 [Gnathostoma spinigerum]|uniref:Uncharacterized protein n=1 Tax=Gnathostoma spinigerum TaxID=75299 RepID=A0ABD6F367_9BILA